jgi:hypothetical protein
MLHLCDLTPWDVSLEHSIRELKDYLQERSMKEVGLE